MGAIHAARPERSLRLKRFVEALRRAGSRGATTRELIGETGFCAINTIASELRKRGYVIPCKLEGRTTDGALVYRYRLVEEPPPPPSEGAQEPEVQAPPIEKPEPEKEEPQGQRELFDLPPPDYVS